MIHARNDYNLEDLEKKIPDDEPVFLIRGQDALGWAAVDAWANLAEAANCDPSIIALARNHAKRMKDWADRYGKMPDLPH
jgi:hypothetical protein